MEYVLNWMVLLLSIGGIILVAVVCWLDFVRGSRRAQEIVPQVADAPIPALVTAEVPPGPFVELSYCRGGAVEHVQRVSAGQPGYIGTEAYAGLGAGMPVRCVEIGWRGGQFYFCNLDWQTPVSVLNEQGEEVEAPMGQALPLRDGAELRLSGSGGWTIRCRICEDGQG